MFSLNYVPFAQGQLHRIGRYETELGRHSRQIGIKDAKVVGQPHGLRGEVGRRHEAGDCGVGDANNLGWIVVNGSDRHGEKVGRAFADVIGREEGQRGRAKCVRHRVDDGLFLSGALSEGLPQNPSLLTPSPKGYPYRRVVPGD